MHKVALIAGPGAGKTTLANAVTARLKDAGMKWYNVQEYAREFIDKHGPAAINRMSIPLLLANKQIGRERKVPKTCDGFITDSPLVLPWFYAMGLAAEPVEKYEILTSLYQMFLRSFLDYTHIFYLKREKEYVLDGTRMQTEEEALGIDNDVRRVILDHGFNMVDVSGTLNERVDFIVENIYPNGPVRKRSAR